MAVNYYYMIDEDNVFWYSGQEFEGSTAVLNSTTINLPSTNMSQWTKIKPYDQNFVAWDLYQAPSLGNANSVCDEIDYSGFELKEGCVQIILSSTWSGVKKFVFPRNCSVLTQGDSSYGSSAMEMFSGLKHVENFACVEYGDYNLPDLPNVRGLPYIFRNNTAIKKITFNDLSKCGRFYFAFSGATSLQEVNFKSDLANAHNFESCFAGCSSLVSVDFPYMELTKYSTSNSISFARCFINCSLLESVNFKNQIVGAFAETFSGCSSLVSFDMKNLIPVSADSMFYNCSLLSSVSNINLSSATTANAMFYNCDRLSEITIKGCKNLLNTTSMFSNCGRLQTVNLDYLANIGDSSSYNADSMFADCTRLETINCSGVKSGARGNNMFLNCTNLVGGNGTTYSSSNAGVSYAKIDGEGGEHGYFTYEVAENYYTLDAQNAAPNWTGYVDYPAPGGRYASGQTTTLSFIGFDGWEIDYWIRWNNTLKAWEKVGTSNTLNIEITANTYIYAIPKYAGKTGATYNVALSVSPVIGGSVVGAGSYSGGVNVDLIATEAEGYVFVGWYEEVGGQSVPISTNKRFTIVKIGRSYNITAVFATKSEEGEDEDPMDTGGTSTTGGGDGSYTVVYDTSPIPAVKTDALASGFISLYQMPVNSVIDLSKFVWSTNFIDNILKFFANPSDAIYYLGLMPFRWGNDYLANDKIYIGNIPAQTVFDPLNPNDYIYGLKINTPYHQIDMGSITVPLYWNAVLDYNPYTKAQIYIPYCGYYNLDIDEIAGKTINLTYNIDMTTGDCVAIISIAGNTKYQFTGNMLLKIPVSGASVNSMGEASGLIAAITGTIAGNVAIAAGGVAGAIMASKQDINRGGAITGNTGFLSSQVPTLFIKRPKQNLPRSYNKILGYPSNITMDLGDLRGYTKVREVHLEGIPATTNEIDEIYNKLTSGVIISYTHISKPNDFTLYTNKSEKECIGKDLETLQTTELIRKNINENEPIYRIANVSENTLKKCNYVYDPEFEKFYFVKDKKPLSNEVWEFICEKDVLETYASYIFNQTAIIERQENLYNLLQEDEMFKTYADSIFEKFNFLSFTMDAYYLLVAGSGEE